MSEHYNVEKIVRQMKRQLDASSLPAGAHNAARVQYRNRELHLHFLRMILTERNLGSSPVEILAGIASIMGNVACNLISDLPPSVQRQAGKAMCDDILRSILERIDGTGDHVSAARLEFEPEQGGHA